MQEKERERKGKNGKIVKIAGCSPIREECCLSGRTPHWQTYVNSVRVSKTLGITRCKSSCTGMKAVANGQPEAEDRESFKVGDEMVQAELSCPYRFRLDEPRAGKSRKLNDDDMMQMQTLASDILLMERGTVKGCHWSEHLERNDFIIEKQKAATATHGCSQTAQEEQINLAEQELKQVKSKYALTS